MHKAHFHAAAITHRLAMMASHARDHRNIPADVVLRAKHSIADWFACAIAGSIHQDARRVRAYGESWAGEGPCTVLGSVRSASVPAAALLNGFSGHVLDWDDVNLESNTHVTAAVLPAAWALAEARKVSGAKLLESYIVGFDATCLLGRMGGSRHYDAGWHASSVLGAFGAGVACSALLGINAGAANTTLSLALAQASGVQAVFGTPGKPFQIARAAEAGVHAALLAEAGLAGRADVLDRARSLPELFSFEFGFDDDKVRADFPLRNTLLKYHASCFVTQAPLEALRELQSRGLAAENLVSLEIQLAVNAVRVSAIEQPSTSSELKFSVAHLCAMRLAGMDTGAVEAYTDEVAKDVKLRTLARKMKVVPVEGLQTAETNLIARLADGRELACHTDMGIPEADLGRQGSRVEGKFAALASPVMGESKARTLFEALLSIEQADELSGIQKLLRAS